MIVKILLLCDFEVQVKIFCTQPKFTKKGKINIQI